MPTEIKKRLFTTRDYHLMGEAGILRPEDRVELIYGEILAMSPIGSKHGAGVDRANRELVRVLGDQAIVRVPDCSIRLDVFLPQPA